MHNATQHKLRINVPEWATLVIRSSGKCVGRMRGPKSDTLSCKEPLSKFVHRVEVRCGGLPLLFLLSVKKIRESSLCSPLLHKSFLHPKRLMPLALPTGPALCVAYATWLHV